MGRDHQHIVAIRPVHNPKHAVAEGGDRLVGPRQSRVARVRRGPIRCGDCRFDPYPRDGAPAEFAFGMFGQAKHVGMALLAERRWRGAGTGMPPCYGRFELPKR